MDYYGYAGSIIRVDLTTGEIRKEPLDTTVGRDFIGGIGINNKIAYDIMKPGVDPLAEDNPVIIGAGPLIGTLTPGACRVVATTKFPLTGAVSTACGSMSFGPELKWAGYDHIVITGKSKHPVYLKVFDDKVELCDAHHLWGKGIGQSTDELKREHGRCGVVSIGQGGENLVSFSLSFVDKLGTMGRGGLAAVMGSKNLKAMVAKGTKGTRVADQKRFRKVIDGLFERVKKYPLHKDCVDLGIVQNWDNYTKQIMFSKNLTEVYPADKATELFGPDIYRKVKKERMSCPSCFIADKDVLEIRDGEYKGLIVHTPSFLNTGIIGARLGFEDHVSAMRLTQVLDDYGLCMLTFASYMDFILFLYESGIITNEDVGGLPLERNLTTCITWIEKMCSREGFGDVAARGWLATVEAIGKGSEKYASFIKGKDVLFDPRLTGLGTMEFEPIVSPRGPTAAFSGSPAYVPGTDLSKFSSHCQRMGASKEQVDRILDSPVGFNVGRLSRVSEDWYSLLTSTGICNRHMNNRFFSAEIIAELYSAATGVEMSSRDIMRSMERAWNLGKALNVREGFSRKDDTIPEQWFQPMKAADGTELAIMDFYKSKVLTREDISALQDDYYDERGWDKAKGAPTRQKLTELGLESVATDLERLGV